MDKLRKKQLKKEYLQQELLKASSSDNEILANFSKQKLGIPLDSIDSSMIQYIPDGEIELRIYNKVLEIIFNYSLLSDHWLTNISFLS